MRRLLDDILAPLLAYIIPLIWLTSIGTDDTETGCSTATNESTSRSFYNCIDKSNSSLSPGYGLTQPRCSFHLSLSRPVSALSLLLSWIPQATIMQTQFRGPLDERLTRLHLQRAIGIYEALSTFFCIAVGIYIAIVWAKYSCRRKRIAKIEGTTAFQVITILWTSGFVSLVDILSTRYAQWAPEHHRQLTHLLPLLQVAGPMLSQLIIYFGLPKFLTFGYQVGKILPATCEASLGVEGYNGKPCSFQRLLRWSMQALRYDSGLHLEQFEALWVRKLATWGSLYLFWLVVLVVAYVLGIREERERRRHVPSTDMHARIMEDSETGHKTVKAA